MKSVISIIVALLLVVTGSACAQDEEDYDYVDTVKFLRELQNSGSVTPYEPNTTICFDYEGCFTNAGPWSNTGNYLPMHPDDFKTEFLLFTRQAQNLSTAKILDHKKALSLEGQGFDPNLPVKIVVHGFSNNRTTEWVVVLIQALLAKENVNIILADWGEGAEFPLYNNASSNARLIGRQIGLFVNDMRRVFYAANPKDLKIHCLGHSLGAHVCSYASNAATIRFNRITGMDPAGPFFEDTDPIVRLDATDADFVDAIHTNGGTLVNLAFGIVMPVGHVDFYPNGGTFQPGCPGLTSIIGGLIGGADPTKDIGCSHNRAIRYLTESISSGCPFVGFMCDTMTAFDNGECMSCENNKCSVMGYYADKYKGRGQMFLATNSDRPYCGFHHLFELHVSSNAAKTAGEVKITIPDNPTKTITTEKTELVADSVVRKMIVTRQDLITVERVKVEFKKKSHWWGKDPNAQSFTFDKLKLTNVEIDETYAECERITVEDGKTVQANIAEGDCAAKSNSLLRIFGFGF